MAFSLIWAHLARNKLRTALTGGSVVMAVFLYCTLQSFLTTLASIGNTGDARRLIAASAVSLFQALPIAMVERIRSAHIPGVLDLGHWTWFDGVYKDPKEFFARFAVDVPVMRRQYGQEIWLDDATWDRFEKERIGCVIGRGLQQRYGLNVGDPVVLEGTIFPGTYKFTVVGIYESHNPAYDEDTLFFHWAYLNETAGEANAVGMIGITISDPARAAEVCAEVDDLFRNSGTRTLTQPEAAFNAQFLGMWGNIGLLFEFIGGAVIFATSMITLNTMLLSVQERVREIGVLKTLGFRSGSLFGLYLVESSILCIGGALIGILLARSLYSGGTLRVPMIVLPGFLCTTRTMAQALLIGVALALVSGIAPAIFARRISITKALRLG
jgi:putative ABC transport system permease protein